MTSQMALFAKADAPPLLPGGMRYVQALITEIEEHSLAAFIESLPLSLSSLPAALKAIVAFCLLDHATTTRPNESPKLQRFRRSCSASARKRLGSPNSNRNHCSKRS